MLIEFDIVDFIYWLFSSFILITAFTLGLRLVLKKDGNFFSNILLGLILFFSALSITNNLLLLTGIKNQYPDLYLIPLDFSLAIGPTLYLYFKSKLKPKYRWKLLDVIHYLLPTLQFCVYCIIGFRSFDYKNSLFKNSLFDVLLNTETILFLVSIFFYTYLSHNLLKQTRFHKVPWNNSLKNWLRMFLKVFIIVQILEIIFYGIELGQEYVFYNSYRVFNYIQILLEILLLLWLCKKAYQQYFPQMIFNDHGYPISKTGLSERKEEHKNDKLSELMLEDKLYRNPDLNLDILSQHMGMSKRKTTQYIKNNFNKSFNDYINDYRLQEVITIFMSQKHQNLTIISIAYDAGFSSKSTFYRHFKMRLNRIPSDYIESPYLVKLI